jgi:hypothetical protein
MDVTFSGYFHIAVTLLFSIITLSLALSFAVRPTDKKLEILRPMSWATLFSILAAIAGGIGATTLHASLAQSGGQTDVFNQVMRGLAEAMVPAVFGFALLALGWMLVSVGLRRQS